MRALRHVTLPSRVYCGADSLRLLAPELDRIGARRAVVFCGHTIAGRPDGLRLVAQALGDRYAGVFDGVKAHSPVPAGIAGAEQLRAQLMLGALLAGQETDYAPTGMNSALSHSIGARYHLDNGVTNAILLPHTMRFNAAVTLERLAFVANALSARASGSPESVAVDAVEHLFAELALPRRLREIGVSQESLTLIAEDAVGDWFLHQNPKPVGGTAELLEILRSAC